MKWWRQRTSTSLTNAGNADQGARSVVRSIVRDDRKYLWAGDADRRPLQPVGNADRGARGAARTVQMRWAEASCRGLTLESVGYVGVVRDDRKDL